MGKAPRRSQRNNSLTATPGFYVKPVRPVRRSEHDDPTHLMTGAAAGDSCEAERA